MIRKPGIKHAIRCALYVRGNRGMTRQEMVDHFTAMGFTETQVINAIQTMANHSPIEIRPNGKARFSHKAKRNTMVYVANHLDSTFDLRLAKGITLSIRAIRK